MASDWKNCRSCTTCCPTQPFSLTTSGVYKPYLRLRNIGKNDCRHRNVLSLHFFTQTAQKKYRHIPLVLRRENQFVLTSRMKALTENSEFLTYLNDCLDYGMYQFHKQTDGQAYAGEFVRYGKYSRKDVSRLLNYKTNREGTLNGYAIVDDNDFETTGRRTCPIFVTYEKSDDISESTKYEDRFIAPDRFSWMTRSRVRLDSREVPKIQSPLTRKLLFVKKS